MLPTTWFGWVAVVAAISAPLCYGIAMAAVALGLETTSMAPPVVIPLLLAVVSAFVALVAAVAALIWRDFTVLVGLAILTLIVIGVWAVLAASSVGAPPAPGQITPPR